MTHAVNILCFDIGLGKSVWPLVLVDIFFFFVFAVVVTACCLSLLSFDLVCTIYGGKKLKPFSGIFYAQKTT